MAEDHAIAPELLLAQQAWVERLARGLVRDSSLAQDLAQEAWLRASHAGELGGRVDAGRLRGYLGGVVRNLQRSAARARLRREVREARVARPEALPSPAQLVEKAELQRLLVESVLALDESERTAILLHYFEGVPAEEIARRAGIPSATVRSRLRRGLERLRERLQSRLPREDLLAGLIGLAQLGPAVAQSPFVPPAASASPAAVPGAALPWITALLTMKTLSLLGAGCALLLALTFWFLTGGDPGLRSSHAVQSASPVAPDLTGPAQADLAEPVAEVPVPAAPRSALVAAVEAPPEPAEVVPLRARVEARLLDASGHPIAGAEVSSGETAVGSSGPSGQVLVELPFKQENEFTLMEFRREGYASERRGVRLQARASIPLGDIVLRKAGTLRGWVEDERGARVAGARVLSTGLENARSDPEELRRLGPLPDRDSVSVLSGPDGRFELAGVPVGSARLWAGDVEQLGWAELGPLEITREGLDDARLVLPPLSRADRIAGIVLDPEGAPVAGASLYTWFMAPTFGQGGFLNTDAQGRFEILLQQRVAYDLTVIDPRNRWSEVYALAVEPGTLELELRFEPARWVDVLVTDPEGHELDQATLEVESAVPGQVLRMSTLSETTPTGQRRLRLPGERFRLGVEAPGRERALVGPFDPALPPAELAVELAPLAGLRGLVLTHAGTPAAGAEVGLYRVVADNLMVEADGFRLRTEGWTDTRTTTDGAGRFVLYPPPLRGGRIGSNVFVLRASAPGHAPTELAPREYDARKGEEVELRLSLGGAIEGRARVAEGVDPTGFVLAFHRGDGKARTVRLGADGHYRLEGLTPGGWNAEALDDEVHGARSSSSSTYYDEGLAPPFEDWDCTVVEGRTTRFDLDLLDRVPCQVQGRLELVGGSPADWTASLEEPGSDEARSSVPLDGEGRFELVAPRAGHYRLILRAPEGGHGRLVLSEALDLVPGEVGWNLSLHPGSLSGAGALSQGTRERFFAYTWTGSVEGHALEAEARLVPDRDGRFRLPTVPAGPGRIDCNDPPGEGQEFSPWETLSTFEVSPGEEQRVLLP